MLSRGDFQTLAKRRLKEAKVLLDNKCYDGALYLINYAVECGLKACIAKQMMGEHFPPTRKFVEKCYTHDLEALFKAAELWSDFQKDLGGNPNLNMNWNAIKVWSEQNRYDPQKTKRQVAADAYRAVNDPTDGVLRW